MDDVETGMGYIVLLVFTFLFALFVCGLLGLPLG